MGSVTDTRLPIGQRLLPHVVDEYAHYEPKKLIASFPTSSKMDGWHDVTYHELARAVNSLAWLIEREAGCSGTFETIGYMGVNDLRYTVFWLAAMKCGYCILCTSPRNSIEGQTSLLVETACTKFFHSAEMSQKVDEMKAAVEGNLATFLIPSYEDLLNSPEVGKPYPFTKSFQELGPKPALIFHTSGSTGLPKPITVVHLYLASYDNLSILPVPEGREPASWTALKPGEKYFSALPAFHAAGATFNLYAPIYTGTVFVLQPHDIPLNEDTFLKIVTQVELTATCLPPSFLEELSNSSRSFEQLAKFKYIFYGGGPLSLPAGNRLNKVANLIQMMGGTEMGSAASLISKKWEYFEWNPYYGADMDPIGDSGVCEMVIRRKPEYAKWHAVFHTFPGITEWRTRDLYIREPSDPNLWLFVGRTDDVIVLSNGEKFNPVSMQGYIQDHPLLASALVIGQGRFQVGLIVEPDYNQWDAENHHPQDLIDQIWPTVQEANHFSTATGRIFKNKIMVTKLDKPFKRAGKGTVLRAPTIASYAEEIDMLYSDTDEESALPLPDIIDIKSMREYVRQCLAAYFVGHEIGDNDDFFALGLDSLQTMGFANSLRAGVEPALKGELDTETSPIAQRTVYQNPTISKMASFLTNLFSITNGAPGANGNNDTAPSREAKITAMIEKYTSDFPKTTKRPAPGRQKDLHVIVTGTTGSLGTYLLHILLTNPDVSKVYCFNRTSDALERTQRSLTEKGLNHSLAPSSSRVEFLQVKFGAHHFGLSKTKYTELVQNVDAIIHNAWTVNFNHQLESFEDPHIRSIRSFIDLSLESRHHAHIFFVSSVGTVGNWAALQEPGTVEGELIPEVPMLDCRVTVPQGYAESKHVSERILAIAADRVGVPASVARVGQIAGPTTAKGRWNDAEWLPSIVKTSKALQLIPSSLGGMQEGGVDWIPVDKMAEGVVELTLSRLDSQDQTVIETFHLVNPRTSEWTSLVPAIEQYFEKGETPGQIVSYEEWIAAVQKVADRGATETEFKKMPVLALVDFFQDMKHMGPRSKLATANAEAGSRTIAQLEPIDAEMMDTWLTQWAY